MIFSLNANTDSRRYNEPTGGEITVVFVGEEDEPPGEIDFTVHPVGTRLRILWFIRFYFRTARKVGM